MDWTYDILGKTVHKNDKVVFPEHVKNTRSIRLGTGIVRSVSPLGSVTVYNTTPKGFRYVRTFAKVED